MWCKGVTRHAGVPHPTEHNVQGVTAAIPTQHPAGANQRVLPYLILAQLWRCNWRCRPAQVLAAMTSYLDSQPPCLDAASENESWATNLSSTFVCWVSFMSPPLLVFLVCGR